MTNPCNSPCGDPSCLVGCVLNRWEVVLDDENIWSVDGEPETFASEEEARQALSDYFKDCKEAFEDGFMLDDCSSDEFIIRRVNK